MPTFTLKSFVCAIALLLAQGCQEKVRISNVVIIKPTPVVTESGVKLQTIESRTIAFIEVIERSPNVKSVTRMTEIEDENVTVGPPILSPVEDVMVYWETTGEKATKSYYTKSLNRSSNIFKMNIGFPGKTRITYGKRTDFDPTFAPDGKSLVFSSNRTGPNPTLWQISLAGGGGITKITNTFAEDYAPCITSDNEYIVYTSNPPSAYEPQIWKVKSNGLLQTQLREGESPQISPDSQKIMFVRRDKESKKKQLWVMNIDGSKETQMTSNVDFDIQDAKWSPDGTKVIYASNEGVDSYKGKHNYDIWMMDSDGTNKTQLTTNGSQDDSPCWDHKGKFVYFRSNRGGTWNIWRFELM